jgi:hypothetical protein
VSVEVESARDAPAGTRPGERRKPDLAGFYGSALPEAEKAVFEAALGVEGFEGEVAVLRTLLHQLSEDGLAHPKLLLKGIDLLVKAVVARFRLSPEDEEKFIESVRRMLEATGELWRES